VSLGSDLSAARGSAGLTLQDVADRTRVRRTVIERIEADDFSLCGGDVYARGHIRTIATVVGTDPAPLVAEFDRLHAPHGPSASEVFEAETGGTRERRGPNWVAAMGAALAVIAMITVFQVARSSGSPAPAAHQSAPTTALTPGSSRPAPTVPTPTASPDPSSTIIAQVPPSAQGVTVRLEVVSGRTWVSATGSGKKLYEGVLSAGSVRLLTDAKLVKIVIGNASAVRLTVNGVDIGSPGGPGQVVRLSFGPGNPTASG
jgi:cytoskeleton protein RodZ